MKKLIYLLFLSLGIFVITCNKTELTSINESMTPHLPSSNYEYNSNMRQFDPIDNQKATLGRVLFYDRKLSQNLMVSCGSCHSQRLGFGDNKAGSIGFSGLKTPRNSIAIINLNKFNPLFWDARRNELDSMVIDPILNHIEMGIGNLDMVIARISKYDYYKDLFRATYGDETITRERMGQAMAEFVKSIRTSDNFNEKLKNHRLTEGGMLFTKYKCDNCHSLGDINTSWGGDMANTGLELEDKDLGAGKTFNQSEMNGFFKIPSLVNVAETGPYMHDGRFQTLDEVLDHYSNGIQPNKNLDFRLREGFDNLIFTQTAGGVNFFSTQKRISTGDKVTPRQSNITPRDRKILIEFLKSLTDQDLLRDPKYANPFVGG